MFVAARSAERSALRSTTDDKHRPHPKYTRVGQWARRGELVHLEVIPLGDEGRHCGSRKASAMLRVEGRSGIGHELPSQVYKG